jgi:hypothetical protein
MSFKRTAAFENISDLNNLCVKSPSSDEETTTYDYIKTDLDDFSCQKSMHAPIH